MPLRKQTVNFSTGEFAIAGKPCFVNMFRVRRYETGNPDRPALRRRIDAGWLSPGFLIKARRILPGFLHIENEVLCSVRHL